VISYRYFQSDSTPSRGPAIPGDEPSYFVSHLAPRTCPATDSLLGSCFVK
jgi:hypothetical protein